jgi:glycosyltransferase involved in cell wall biosynthesis
VRIAVINNVAPFVRGGAEILAEALTRRLEDAGHTTDLVRLPFSWQPTERIVDSMLAASLTRVSGVDRVIALKFPAYLVPHDDRVLWTLHQFRQFYDLWDTPSCGYPMTDETLEVRALVQDADSAAFGSASKIYANSRVTADRLFRFNGFASEVLHAPLPNAQMFTNLGTGVYVFAGGRINALKRQNLAVDAMRYTQTDVRLVVAGAPETRYDLEQLESARQATGREDRITVIPRYVDEQRKATLVNGSLACVYCPLDEDSYGYVALEGAQAAKALVTTIDAGGVTDLAIDGRSGFVCEPDPIELARAFDALYRSTVLAESLGRAAHDRMSELHISWDHVIRRLTG